MEQKTLFLIRLHRCDPVVNHEVIGGDVDELAHGLAALLRRIAAGRISAGDGVVRAFFKTERTVRRHAALAAVVEDLSGNGRRIGRIPVRRQRLVLHPDQNRIMRDGLRIVDPVMRRRTAFARIERLKSLSVDDEAVLVVMLVLRMARPGFDRGISVVLRRSRTHDHEPEGRKIGGNIAGEHLFRRFGILHFRVEAGQDERQIRVGAQREDLPDMRRNHLHHGPRLLRAFRLRPAVKVDRLRKMRVHEVARHRVGAVERIAPAEIEKAVLRRAARNRGPGEPVAVIAHLGPVLRAVDSRRAFKHVQKVVARPRILPEAVAGTDRGQQPAAARNFVAQIHHGGIESVPVPQQLLRPRIIDAVAVSGEPGIELQPRFAVVAGLGAAAVAHITRILHMFDVLQHRPEEAAPFLRRQLVVKPVVCDKSRKARVVEPLRQNPAAVAPFDEFDQQLQIPLRFLEIRPVAGRKIENRAFERFGAAGGFHRVNRGVLVVQELLENELPVLHLGDIGLEFQPGLRRERVDPLLHVVEQRFAERIRPFPEGRERLARQEHARMVRPDSPGKLLEGGGRAERQDRQGRGCSQCEFHFSVSRFDQLQGEPSSLLYPAPSALVTSPSRLSPAALVSVLRGSFGTALSSE